MSQRAGEETLTLSASSDATWQDNVARKLLLRRMAGLHDGVLTVVEGTEAYRLGTADGPDPIEAALHVRHPRFYREVVLGGAIGAGRAYMAGLWSSPDLSAFFRLMTRNIAFREGLGRSWAMAARGVETVRHWLRRNTLRGSRDNIAFHYDVGNDFYALWLDDTMTYSSGIFDSPEATLRDASIEKYDRLCRKLELRPSDHLVEIGTGWGGMAIHAAGQYGCRVTTTTISPSQHEYACRKVREAGLEDRIELVLRDYRQMTGHYDKLVSIEMIEAVGDNFMDGYFRKCSDLLKPDGVMALQAITYPDQRYREQMGGPNFIQKYIFPGSCIPSLARICEGVRRSTDLRLYHMEDITPHYARTLRLWRERFLERVEEARALGYSETFLRMWEYYLAHCEGGFAEGFLGDVQVVFTKPRYQKREAW